MELGLLQFQKPQPFPRQLIGDRLHGGRLAGACRSVKEGVGRRFPFEKRFRIGKEGLFLPLVPVKVRKDPGVRGHNRDDFRALQAEHVMVGIHAVAF